MYASVERVSSLDLSSAAQMRSQEGLEVPRGTELGSSELPLAALMSSALGLEVPKATVWSSWETDGTRLG